MGPYFELRESHLNHLALFGAIAVFSFWNQGHSMAALAHICLAIMKATERSLSAEMVELLDSSTISFGITVPKFVVSVFLYWFLRQVVKFTAIDATYYQKKLPILRAHNASLLELLARTEQGIEYVNNAGIKLQDHLPYLDSVNEKLWEVGKQLEKFENATIGPQEPSTPLEDDLFSSAQKPKNTKKRRRRKIKAKSPKF